MRPPSLWSKHSRGLGGKNIILVVVTSAAVFVERLAFLRDVSETARKRGSEVAWIYLDVVGAFHPDRIGYIITSLELTECISVSEVGEEFWPHFSTKFLRMICAGR